MLCLLSVLKCEKSWVPFFLNKVLIDRNQTLICWFYLFPHSIFFRCPNILHNFKQLPTFQMFFSSFSFDFFRPRLTSDVVHNLFKPPVFPSQQSSVCNGLCSALKQVNHKRAPDLFGRYSLFSPFCFVSFFKFCLHPGSLTIWLLLSVCSSCVLGGSGLYCWVSTQKKSRIIQQQGPSNTDSILQQINEKNIHFWVFHCKTFSQKKVSKWIVRGPDST